MFPALTGRGQSRNNYTDQSAVSGWPSPTYNVDVELWLVEVRGGAGLLQLGVAGAVVRPRGPHPLSVALARGVT